MCPSVTTLASAILNRSSPNFAWWFGTRIVRTSSLGIKIGQQLPVLRACAENPQCKEYGKKLTFKKNTHNITFLAKISQIYRFLGMPDQMAWSDLIPEVVFWPFLRMRSKNMAQIPRKIAFLANILWLYSFSTMHSHFQAHMRVERLVDLDRGF